MICEDCGKNNAEVIIKTVINGQIIQKELCRECAQKLQLPGIQNILAGAIANSVSAQQDHSPKCPACGFSFGTYIKKGYLGCEKCYDSFKTLLKRSLPGLDESVLYTGRVPDEKVAEVRTEIRRQLNQLNAHVLTENYEFANACREKIMQLCTKSDSEEYFGESN